MAFLCFYWTCTADVKFFRNLRVTCQNVDKEWGLRSKTHSEENQAVPQALAIITEDDNKEMLHKAQGLLQIFVSTEDAARLPEPLCCMEQPQVFSVASPRVALSILAVTVSLDGFEKVTAAVDKSRE